MKVKVLWVLLVGMAVGIEVGLGVEVGLRVGVGFLVGVSLAVGVAAVVGVIVIFEDDEAFLGKADSDATAVVGVGIWVGETAELVWIRVSIGVFLVLIIWKRYIMINLITFFYW